MFEVGKQYEGKTTGRIVEVIGVGIRYTFVRTVESGQSGSYLVGDEDVIVNDQFEGGWKPYEPEVTNIRDIDVFFSVTSGEFLFTNQIKGPRPIPASYTYAGGLTVIHSSKSGLSVDLHP